MNKYSISAIFLAIALAGVSVSPLIPAALGATAKTSVVGMAKFTAQGSVVAASTDSFTFHAKSASKNAAFIKAKDQVISAGQITKITKGGKKSAFTKLSNGTKVKIFGVFDKKTNSIVKVNWVKILP